MFKSNLNLKSTLVATTLALSAFSMSAQATLTSYTNGGVDLVYSSVSDVTWTKDANLLGTLIANSTDANGNGTKDVIESIVAAGAANGITVTAANFNSNGTTTWLGTLAYVSYLNSISYGGSNQWYLPTVANTTVGYNTATNGTAKGDELVELFYSELNGTANNAIPNTSTFDNEQATVYWSGTEFAPGHIVAWYFGANRGNLNRNVKNNLMYAWAVSPGQINTATPSAVPVPAAAWLFGSGLLGLVGLRRRKQVV